MKGSLGFVEKLLGGSAKDNRAGPARCDAREPDQRILSYDDLFDKITVAELDRLRVVECRCDLAARDQC